MIDLKQVKLDVCWFCYRAAGATPLINLHEMLRYTREQGVDVSMLLYGNSLIHHSRNRALSGIREDATHILMVDDDMMCEKDAAVKLLHLNVPVASALTTNRQPPIHLIPHIWQEGLGKYIPIDNLNPGKAVKGKFALGAAFLLMDRATVDALIEDYLEANDWMRENYRTMDRMVAKWELRDKERRRRSEIRKRRYEDTKLIRVFRFPVDDDETELSEDFALGERFRALGIEPTVDGRVMIGHMGEYPYGVWDMIYREDLQEAIANDYDFDPRQYMPPSVRRFFDEYLRKAA